MMITGKQIRLGREMLGWSQRELSLRARVPIADVARAESVDETPGITLAYGTFIQQAFERAGLEFDFAGGVSKSAGHKQP